MSRLSRSRMKFRFEIGNPLRMQSKFDAERKTKGTLEGKIRAWSWQNGIRNWFWFSTFFRESVKSGKGGVQCGGAAGFACSALFPHSTGRLVARMSCGKCTVTL